MHKRNNQRAGLTVKANVPPIVIVVLFIEIFSAELMIAFSNRIAA